MKLWNHADAGCLGPVLLLAFLAVVVVGQACTSASGHDPNGNPYTYREWGTNRNLVRVNEHSSGRATLNPFAGILGGANSTVTVIDEAGRVQEVTTADRLRNVEVLPFSALPHPTIAIGGDTGIKIYGTQDQTSAIREVMNGWTNVVLIKWMGRVWTALIGETGDVVIRAIDAGR